MRNRVSTSSARGERRAGSISRPLISTLPEVGASSPSSILASVLLPQPDSPTRPSVSPLRMRSETLFTA